MYLLSQLWVYLLLAAGFGALLGAVCYGYCRSGWLQNQLHSLRQHADTEAAALRSRIVDIDGQRMQAIDRLNVLDAQFETIRTSSERALDTFAERIRELESSLHARETQFRAAEARVGSEVTAHAQTRARLQELEAAHSSLAADRDRLEQALGALRDEVAGARGLVQEIDAAGRGRELALQTEINALQDRLGETRVRLTAAQQGEYAVKAELESQSRRDAARDGELLAARAELGEAHAARAQAEERAQSMLAELESLRGSVSAARAEAEAAASAADAALRQQLSVAQAAQRDAEQLASRLRDELAQERNRQASAGTEVDALQAELTARRDELSSQRSRGQALETELSDLRRQLVELSARTKTSGVEEQRLRDELQRLRQRESALADELTRLRRELDESRNGLRIARSREETLIAEVSEMHANVNAERAAAERLATELNALTQSRSNRNFEPSIVASMEPERLAELVLAAGSGRRPGNAMSGGAGEIDDLKEIGGIGPVNEKWLHDQGIFCFWQIASWVPEELAWVAQNLPNFGTRVYRENWVAQATRLARGEVTDAKRKYQEGKHR